jgi:hypothetical protein
VVNRRRATEQEGSHDRLQGRKAAEKETGFAVAIEW